jgi:hypothetical protein
LAKAGQVGNPLYVVPNLGSGRINNPDLYQVSYWAKQKECAISETFGEFRRWNKDTFRGKPNLPGSTYAIATASVPENFEFFEMDDVKNLNKLKLKPSRVVTRNQEETQAWARFIFENSKTNGISWWSIYWPEWQSLGLWNIEQLKIEEIEILSIKNPDVIQAANTINKILS